jgi:UDP-galactopyranose mutase
MQNIQEKRILVVGAGISGATIARMLAESGFEITIVEKKNHIAGNCYDYIDNNGIRIHKYGPHLFHTSKNNVINWLSKFTDWIDYKHHVVARLSNGDLVPFPPNLKTLEKVKKEDLLNVFYRPYTEKMWGTKLEKVNPGILKRVPIRDSLENYYFPKDNFQKLPKEGYTALITKMLKHDLINVKININYKKEMSEEYFHTFNSMPIDEFFNYKFGHLPYRSIKFHHKTERINSLSKFPVINFTDKSPYTRQTEWKNFPNNNHINNITVTTKEEPCDYKENNEERYYPVNDKDGSNRKLYRKYAMLVPRNTTFIGRCGLYTYIDMDDAVESALLKAKSFLNKFKKI